MTKASRDTQGGRKEREKERKKERGRERERREKRKRQVFGPLRPRTPCQNGWLLGPLRSRRGMSQLGIPKMRQTSHFLWRKPSAVRSGHLHLQSKGDNDVPPFNGSHGRHSAGSSRVGTRPNTLRIGCTELKAVPHASLSKKPKENRVGKMKRFKSPRGQGLRSSKVPNCNRETIERQGRRNVQSLRMKNRCKGWSPCSS